ncbi:hypothetical protein FHT60_001823 [Novosphingobium sp. BK486]|nr:hypothetical protein [Novosphingobium sp. BK256]MBB3374372.1 hypothetical protein [Novosphingobium sp. BK280]MBB3378784.1 hypothetical protein [Novosphingobium sp. BK258]MBB3420478.1 hypothetical protein [Novosphingobium sp. BK267]MBB3448400.1 hypothetical protein [Novosphingobium sp. BK352]MBB3501114.1 hypothetical protein [Novosphingobium sp. BK336]MBB3536744.1 hypothetical protein [Novosphingobium sp. BK486]MBB3556141.1 hypothetical protein [Novosphingobium sp. BK349]MBB3597761.1 hypo
MTLPVLLPGFATRFAEGPLHPDCGPHRCRGTGSTAADWR